MHIPSYTVVPLKGTYKDCVPTTFKKNSQRRGNHSAIAEQLHLLQHQRFGIANKRAGMA